MHVDQIVMFPHRTEFSFSNFVRNATAQIFNQNHDGFFSRSFEVFI